MTNLQSRYYDPAIARFLNADTFVSTGQGVLGNNMFAYCGNNPVSNADQTGYYYCKVSFDAFCPLDSQLVNLTGGSGGGSGLCWSGAVAQKPRRGSNSIFGAGVVQSNNYASFGWDTLLGGVESGFSTSKTICGDVGKPISVYAENASDWWKLNEYKVGIQFNAGGSGCSVAYGLGENSINASFGNGTAIEIIGGVNKFGVTVYQNADFGKRTAGAYTHVYIRGLPTMGLVALLVYCPELLAMLVASGQPVLA